MLQVELKYFQSFRFSSASCDSPDSLHASTPNVNHSHREDFARELHSRSHTAYCNSEATSSQN